MKNEITHPDLQLNNRIDYLDGIRGIASLIVFFYHYFLCFYPALFILKSNYSHTTSNIEASIAKTPICILYSGGFAVCIFFVLSGYVLSYKYFLNKNYEYLAASAIKRYFRLVIPILTSVLISYFILSFGGYSNVEIATDYTKCTFWFSHLWNINPNFFDALKQGIFSTLFNGKSLNYNDVLWTMNIEFMGSLLVFAILALVGNLRKRYLIYLILILVFWKDFMPAFIVGLALCDYYTTKERARIKPIFLILLTLPIIYFGSYQKMEDYTIWQPLDFLSKINTIFPFLIASGLLIVVVVNSKEIQNFLSRKWFKFLGKISFSLYLIHLLILGSISCYLFNFFYVETSLDYFSSFLFTILISLTLALFLSYLMYRFIDRNATKFSANIFKWIFKP